MSLTWKAFLAISAILAALNACMAGLAYIGSLGQFESEQIEKRRVQARELEAAFARGGDSMSRLSSFIPQLAGYEGQPAGGNLRDRIAAGVSRHGMLLNVEWGVEGIHYFENGEHQVPTMSWPEGRRVPAVADLVERADSEDQSAGSIICETECLHVSALPVLDRGETGGILTVERALGDSLKEFHQLTGADVILVRGSLAAQSGDTAAPTRWLDRVVGTTQGEGLVSMLQELSASTGPVSPLGEPRTMQVGTDWYELAAVDSLPESGDMSAILVNRVTDQVLAIHRATTDSVVLGTVGLLVSELLLLVLLWGPMRRVQEVASALPLLAEKSFAQLRDQLPRRPRGSGPRNEVDAMVEAIWQVSDRIEALDEANKTAEEALRASERRLQLAQSMARVVSWSGKPIGGSLTFGDGARRISPVLSHVTRWSEFLDLVHHDDRLTVVRAWRAGMPGGVMDVEFRLLLGDIVIDIHAIAQFEAVGVGRTLCASGMMQDVSEMRSVQRRLARQRDGLEEEFLKRTSDLVAARKHAEQLAQRRSEFLADMSHEIRTPLNAVLGLSQVGRQESRNRQIATTFDQILSAGDHLLNVVNGVLDLSKLEAGRMVADSDPFDVRQAVGRCADMLRPRCEQKSLALSVKVDDTVERRLLGDEFRLQQILINLLGNAVKFTAQGSVSLDVRRESGEVCFEVTDSGPGMSAKQVKQLFSPYYQVAGSARANREGTGLGLSISKRLADLMGGDIQVSSAPGEGSCFSLRLPLPADDATEDDAGEQGIDARAPAPGSLKGLRVLVADDVSINRTVVEYLLQVLGAEVTAVAEGAQAVSLLTGPGAEHFDVVLMDVQMPVMDGRQATRLIREAGLDVPVIGMTAFATEADHLASLDAGMQRQLTKPILQDALVAAIAACIVPGASPEAMPAVQRPGSATVH